MSSRWGTSHPLTTKTFDLLLFLSTYPYKAPYICPPAGDVPLVSSRATSPSFEAGHFRVLRRGIRAQVLEKVSSGWVPRHGHGPVGGGSFKYTLRVLIGARIEFWLIHA